MGTLHKSRQWTSYPMDFKFKASKYHIFFRKLHFINYLLTKSPQTRALTIKVEAGTKTSDNTHFYQQFAGLKKIDGRKYAKAKTFIKSQEY